MDQNEANKNPSTESSKNEEQQQQETECTFVTLFFVPFTTNINKCFANAMPPHITTSNEVFRGHMFECNGPIGVLRSISKAFAVNPSSLVLICHR